MNAELLKILRCPETRQPLRMAEPELVERVNGRITSNQAKNRAGQPVTSTIEEGLVREDGKFLYPVRETIPVMLIDEAIPLD